MARRLDDYRVGEYKASVLMNFLQSLFILYGIVSLFLSSLPGGIKIVEEPGEGVYVAVLKYKIIYQSPVRVLENANFNEFKSILALACILYIGYLFMNLFISLLLPSIGRSVYVKASKIVEVVLGLILLIGFNYYLFTIIDIDNELINIGGFIRWQFIILLNVFASLLSYYKVKKISIYD